MTIHIDLSLWPWLLLASLWVFFYQLWVHYLAVMKLKDALRTSPLRPAARFFGYWQVLPGGGALDWLGNVVFCTVIFLDLPGDWVRVQVWRWSVPVLPKELITGRLQRYVNDHPGTWRARWAWEFASDMLNPFDQPDGHIKDRTA